MSLWSTLRRWLGLAAANPAEVAEIAEVAVNVTRDVVTVAAAGATPAGAAAAIKTARDVVAGVDQLRSDGTIPFPLTAKTVSEQQRQIKSAARPFPPPKPPTPGRS